MKEFILISIIACAVLWIGWKVGSPTARWFKLRRKIRNLKMGDKFLSRGRKYIAINNWKNLQCVETFADVIDYEEITDVL